MSIHDISMGNHIEKMRSLVLPLVSRLKSECLIDSYCLLIHYKDSGVPTDDSNSYLHLRVAFTKELSKTRSGEYFRPSYLSDRRDRCLETESRAFIPH